MIHTEDNKIVCKNCGNSAIVNEYADFSDSKLFYYINQWKYFCYWSQGPAKMFKSFFAFSLAVH